MVPLLVSVVATAENTDCVIVPALSIAMVAVLLSPRFTETCPSIIAPLATVGDPACPSGMSSSTAPVGDAGERTLAAADDLAIDRDPGPSTDADSLASVRSHVRANIDVDRGGAIGRDARHQAAFVYDVSIGGDADRRRRRAGDLLRHDHAAEAVVGPGHRAGAPGLTVKDDADGTAPARRGDRRAGGADATGIGHTDGGRTGGATSRRG